MPEIPGTPIPGGTLPGARGPMGPSGAQLAGGAVGGAGGVGSVAEELVARPQGRGPRYFGVHTDASIMARVAALGLATTGEHLAVAKQLLRYGQALEGEAVAEIGAAWQQVGGDASSLEALVALRSVGAPITAEGLRGMLQVLAGGPMSHLLARLTMAVKAENNPKLAGLGQHLTAIWKLGHLDKAMGPQLSAYQDELAGLARELRALDPGEFGADCQNELRRLDAMLDGQRLLAEQAKAQPFVPFHVWREQQPLPGELVVQQDGGGGEAGAAPFVRVTLATETVHLGRITVEFVLVRGRLGLRFEVQEERVKKALDGQLGLLRQRLMSRYPVEYVACQVVGAGRSGSALLPKRRDVSRLARAQGIM